MTGPNELVSFVVRQALQELGMASSVTRNLFKCSQHFCIPPASLLLRKLTSADLRIRWNKCLSVEDVAIAHASLELLFAREGHFVLDGFMRGDVGALIDYVSIL
jgi:hypothetical protein